MKYGVRSASTFVLAAILGPLSGCQDTGEKAIADAGAVSVLRDSAMAMEELPTMLDDQGNVIQREGGVAVERPDPTPADPESGDPGTPSTPYGAKADASLFVGTEEVGYVAYTAVAPNRSDLAHLYAAPDVRQSKGVTSYYLSLVMERAAWHAGEFTAPVGGRVRFTLKDGRTYSANGVGLNIRLSLKGAGALSTDTESILRGTMEIVIPAELSGQEPLRVKSQINTP